ncbi:hypothetical protein M501DRAFT_981125 [Patellaria atrata CBS 101060]|uniref:DUF7907 domain-containing protein n=1 Tax=Patellaria atrata CBS 101060 TaxID=1346257 RepID=A0A9P4S417_9PEZI|nr:hypothetical protein M501DRAFT_981125 [Patellaria atrata CBS 101060]
MRSFATASLLLGAATHVAAQYYNQSAPFNLVLKSVNETLDGKYLTPCHSGAAIENLCVYDTPSAYPYFYNYSDTPDFTSDSGYLTWDLHGGNFVVNEPMVFSYNPSSNLALPQLQPGYGELLIAFDEDEKLYVPAYIDDSVDPIEAGESFPLYRWFACQTYYSAYRYLALSWQLGNAPPQNPTCQAVNVTRVFTETAGGY